MEVGWNLALHEALSFMLTLALGASMGHAGDEVLVSHKNGPCHPSLRPRVPSECSVLPRALSIPALACQWFTSFQGSLLPWSVSFLRVSVFLSRSCLC